MNAEAWVASLIAAAVSAVMLERSLKLRRIATPSVGTLLAELRAAVPEIPELDSDTDRRLDVGVYRNWELDERLIEVQASARHEPELGSALSRVSLASGTALALLALIRDGALSARVVQGALTMLAGVVGAGLVSYLGRSARLRARAIREHWARIGKSARRELELRSAR